ncbi:PIR Superfamily Protein [Plasmodium ovale wallikeri]|uniref:PIR Superfamily Protein n=1 Tax=Plasmodium ovale wallikeri TaxID=864142 RepID=A0A1A9AG62_PLAOA|nr:PIR Superfamily Protein [Plasmodium ovale wallikeri]SBT56293.1 PIR Superfamily Protein [Plasmodium ovale wallikeri]
MEYEYINGLLKDSAEYKKYNNFDNVISPDNYEFSFNEALNIGPDKDKIKSICQKLAGNLEVISKSAESPMKNEESCGYLHFWLYHKIDSNFKSHDNIKDIAEKIIDGANIYNSIISNDNCSIRFSYDIDLEKWIKGKHLHDYFKNVDYIRQTYDSNDNECEEYSKYISYIKTLYKNLNSIYYATDIYRYLESYENEIYNPQNVISELNCKNRNSAMHPYTHQPVANLVSVGHGESLSTLTLDDAKSDSIPTDSNSSSIAGVSVSLVGMFILFFTAYKFTPLGSWIYEKMTRKERIRHNRNHVTDTILDNHSEYMDINEDISKFHLAYNSS